MAVGSLGEAAHSHWPGSAGRTRICGRDEDTGVTMQQDDFPEVDTTVASAARMYDYALGGIDNYAVDRQAAETLEDMMPGAISLARGNRRFLERAVHYLAAECGIRQYIDFGSGLPTQNNVHQIAQSIIPDARIVYVDADPVVLRHQKVSALLTENKSTAFILADLRDIEQILNHPDTQRLIDFGEPVAALFISVLHFVPDAADPWYLVRQVMERLVPGSYLGISHVSSESEEVRRTYTDFFLEHTGGHFGRVREVAEVRTFFDGLELTEPGVVELTSWRADEPMPVQGNGFTEYGGLGRKPA